jgi:hypothetical protein
MPAFDRVGTTEIFKQGVVIAGANDVVYFDVPEISVNPVTFSVEIILGPSFTEYEDEDLRHVYIKLKTGFNVHSSNGNYDAIEFGSDDRYRYVFNYIVTFVGFENDYLYSLNYNFVRKPK